MPKKKFEIKTTLRQIFLKGIKFMIFKKVMELTKL